MKSYNFKFKIEGQDSLVLATERANDAIEAEQKLRERYGRLKPGKEITIIKIDPPV